MSTSNIFWGKGGRCVELTNLPPSYADCLQIWGSQPLDNFKAMSRPVQSFLYVHR